MFDKVKYICISMAFVYLDLMLLVGTVLPNLHESFQQMLARQEVKPDDDKS